MNINGKPECCCCCGVTPSGTLSITSNGTYDVYLYSSAEVSVPTASMTGLSVISNGEYNPSEYGVDGFSQVTVSVPVPSFVTETLSVSANGTYTPGVGVDGFSQVTVNVSGGGGEGDITQKQLTEQTFVINNLSNSASFVNNNVFWGRSDIQTVNLPSCLEVKPSAFCNCSNLTKVNLPAVSSLGFGAFDGCTRLSTMSLCTDVYYTAEYGNNALQSTYLANIAGSIYVRSERYDEWISKTGWSSLSSYFISVSYPEPALSYSEGSYYGTTKYIFSNCYDYVPVDDIPTSISFPNCVMIDGLIQDSEEPDYYHGVFFGADNLSEVYIPACEYIGDSTFTGCWALTQIDLPACKYIGSWVFAGDYQLSQVSLPVCEYIGERAFCGDDYGDPAPCALTELDLPMCSYIGSYAFIDNPISQVSLPVCEYIGESAFTNYGGKLLQIDLPMCSYIGSGAFQDIESLSQIDIPMCTYIGKKAFAGCHSLSQVSLPVCEYIASSAFYGAELNQITLGYSGVCIIESDVFKDTTIGFTNKGSIYVPASLVSAYQSANNWSAFASKIFPIV